MGVALDYYVHITQIRGHIFLVMDQEEAYAFDGKGAVEREFLCPFFIVVAPDDIKGTKACQSVYNGLGVNVPAVDDNVGLGQKFQYLGPQKAVGIGKNGGVLHGRFPFQGRL